ncbi:MAG: EAL and GGDEF domain-containing protein [Gammaproteobacteria bacterium]|nr:EAL and GGDEF domain-containing protein [Gammaproteobacteria bacterium]
MGGERTNEVLLKNLILNEELSIVFQPICNTEHSSIMGYEALTRLPEGHLFNSPTVLFDVAERSGLLSELELLCRKMAIQRFAELKLQGKLFLNVSPHTIVQKQHPHGETLNLVKQFGLTPEIVVIEVTERFEASDPTLLKESLQHYRNAGFSIAIDDLGTGHSGLRQWAELRPDIVKIDRYFISGCPSNIVKRELLRTIFDLGKATGVEIIAEGIEQNDEYLLLQKLGMKYAQGYLLAKPEKTPTEEFPVDLVNLSRKKSIESDNLDESEFEISHLVKNQPPIHTQQTCLEIYKLFKQSERINALVVIDQDEQPIGMVYRDQLAELLSSNYGHALYDKKPISSIMTPINFNVDISASIDDVSAQVTDNEELDQRPEFVVVNQGKYWGVANVRSLLKKMTEEKIKHAQHANPLTMLPGNIVIQQRMNHLLKHKQAFKMAYFDLDYFKPFNDLYGYAAGDAVIKLVAEILTEQCHGQFIGHVGGDDFVVIFNQIDIAKGRCESVIKAFNERIVNYFEDEHIQNNGYHAIGREGSRQFFPLLALSCGVITPNVLTTTSHHDVAILATHAKKLSKKLDSGEVFELAS